MIKRMTVIARRDRLSREEFNAHWTSRHAEFVARLPGLRRYVQNMFSDDETLKVVGASRQADAIGEIWFDDEESLQKALSTPEWLAVVDDMKSISTEFKGFLVTEKEVVG